MTSHARSTAAPSWAVLSVTSSVIDNYKVITQSATNGAGFFRLTH